MRKVKFSFPEEIAPTVVKTNIPKGVVMDSLPNYIDSSYNKGHDVPEGMYLVKLVDIKCHSKDRYRMVLQVVGYKDEPVIVGYSDRQKYWFYDLANCFSDEVLHIRASKYIGGLGFVWLSHSGWVSLMTRDWDMEMFPNFKLLVNEKWEEENSFESFLKRFG